MLCVRSVEEAAHRNTPLADPLNFVLEQLVGSFLVAPTIMVADKNTQLSQE